MPEDAQKTERIAATADLIQRITSEVSQVVVGQETMIRRLLLGLLSGGHVLLEGVPGLAKSLAVETLARTLDLAFQRIQFTPDLLPADLIGTPIFHPTQGRFEVKKGPIFANLILADEINRAPAKVHSALLQAMQERAVTIGEETFDLDRPFLVLATQNPIEHEGTYPLPEAELDRFLLKVVVTYPDSEQESEIISRMARTSFAKEVAKVAALKDIMAASALVNDVYVDERLVNYSLEIVRATRDPGAVGLDELKDALRLGASPRASVNLVLAARTNALMDGRSFATPDDVKAVVRDVLRHRLLLSYEAEADELTPDHVLDRILGRVEIP